MMIYVVLWSYYDDWELVGATSDKEVAEQMKRDFVMSATETLRDAHFKNVHIVPCEDGKVRAWAWESV